MRDVMYSASVRADELITVAIDDITFPALPHSVKSTKTTNDGRVRSQPFRSIRARRSQNDFS